MKDKSYQATGLLLQNLTQRATPIGPEAALKGAFCL